ncbi:MAG: hypothetical protein JSV30_04020 [Candidatus Omnitrophota bacterium]|nr:MAG: hypothetical protein JSV30_04020 [Candidatus Omnitrophota bacterium]
MSSRRLTLLQKKAEKAIKEAVRKVVEEHRRKGEPLVIWQKGKVKLVPPTQQLLRKVK